MNKTDRWDILKVFINVLCELTNNDEDLEIYIFLTSVVKYMRCLESNSTMEKASLEYSTTLLKSIPTDLEEEK